MAIAGIKELRKIMARNTFDYERFNFSASSPGGSDSDTGNVDFIGGAPQLLPAVLTSLTALGKKPGQKNR